MPVPSHVDQEGHARRAITIPLERVSVCLGGRENSAIRVRLDTMARTVRVGTRRCKALIIQLVMPTARFGMMAKQGLGFASGQRRAQQVSHWGRNELTVACHCAHGTCTSSGDCICAAGWMTSTNQTKCSSCAKGFYEDTSGNCLGMSNLSGCADLSLSSRMRCVRIAGWVYCKMYILYRFPVAVVRQSAYLCIPRTVRRRDILGELKWILPKVNDGFGVASAHDHSCSPACSTCTGPSPSECLACASPRVNLEGQCVGYDASVGVCDSSLSGMQGVFVVNNGKQKCDGELVWSGWSAVFSLFPLSPHSA